MSKIKQIQNKLEVENKRQIVDFYLFIGSRAFMLWSSVSKTEKNKKKKEIKKNKAYQINLLKLGKK